MGEDEIEWVRQRGILVAAAGFATAGASSPVPAVPNGKYTPFRVVANKRFNFAYSWEEDYPAPFLPLGPVGLSGGIPGLAQPFLAQHLLPQVQQVSQVTNLFLITKPNEAYQVGIGVAPSWLRVFPEQPANTPTYVMDQNLNLSTSFYDEGWFDGYDEAGGSPYDRPTKISEMLVLAGWEPTFSLLNPVSVLTHPVLKFYMNRLELAAITDEDFATSIALGLVKEAHFVGVGDPTLPGGIDLGNYPGALTVTVPSSGKPTAAPARMVA